MPFGVVAEEGGFLSPGGLVRRERPTTVKFLPPGAEDSVF